jgi:hypothetical protein
MDDVLAHTPCSSPLDLFSQITVEKAGRTVATVDQHYVGPFRKGLSEAYQAHNKARPPIGDVQL